VRNEQSCVCINSSGRITIRSDNNGPLYGNPICRLTYQLTDIYMLMLMTHVTEENADEYMTHCINIYCIFLPAWKP